MAAHRQCPSPYCGSDCEQSIAEFYGSAYRHVEIAFAVFAWAAFLLCLVYAVVTYRRYARQSFVARSNILLLGLCIVGSAATLCRSGDPGGFRTSTGAIIAYLSEVIGAVFLFSVVWMLALSAIAAVRKDQKFLTPLRVLGPPTAYLLGDGAGVLTFFVGTEDAATAGQSVIPLSNAIASALVVYTMLRFGAVASARGSGATYAVRLTPEEQDRYRAAARRLRSMVILVVIVGVVIIVAMIVDFIALVDRIGIGNNCRLQFDSGERASGSRLRSYIAFEAIPSLLQPLSFVAIILFATDFLKCSACRHGTEKQVPVRNSSIDSLTFDVNHYLSDARRTTDSYISLDASPSRSSISHV